MTHHRFRSDFGLSVCVVFHVSFFRAASGFQRKRIFDNSLIPSTSRLCGKGEATEPRKVGKRKNEKNYKPRSCCHRDGMPRGNSAASSIAKFRLRISRGFHLGNRMENINGFRQRLEFRHWNGAFERIRNSHRTALGGFASGAR